MPPPGTPHDGGPSSDHHKEPGESTDAPASPQAGIPRTFEDESGVLSFTSSGEFNHLLWKVELKGDSTSLLTQLVTIHEWAHHELNNVTSFGCLLTCYAHLAKYGKEPRERYREMLAALVNRCRTAHEVYATWQSVQLMSVKASVDSLLQHLPQEYLDYHANGEALVKDIASPFLRQQAFLCAVRLCFESTALAVVTGEFSSFKLSDVRGREFPNDRLRALPGILPAGFFEQEMAAYLAAEENPGYAEILRRARDAPAIGIFEGDEGRECDRATAELHRWLHTRLAELLTNAGLPTNPYHHHLDLFRQVLPSLDSHCEESDDRVRLIPNRDPLDNATNLLIQMENEIVELRPEPLPADWDWFGDLEPLQGQRLLCGDPAHVFICVRYASQILNQHAFPADKVEALRKLEGPLVFARTRRATPAGPQCELYLFRTPEELQAFRRQSGVPFLGTITMTAQAYDDWADRWLGSGFEGIFCATLFDRSLISILQDGWPQFDWIRYETASLSDGENTFPFLVLLGGNSAGCNLFLTPCSRMLPNAVDAYLRAKFPGGKFAADPQFLRDLMADGDLSGIMTHLIREEHYSSINFLRYE